MSISEHFGINIILLGDYQVGKSTFRTTYINGRKLKRKLSSASDSIINRSNSDAGLHKKFIKSEIYEKEFYDHILTDFITTDQRYSINDNKVENGGNILMSNSDIYLLFIDINDEKTFTSLDFWNEKIKEHNSKDDFIPKIVIATKIDLPWKISESKIHDWCLSNKTSYRMISSYENIGFENLFEEICFKVLNSRRYLKRITESGLYSKIPYYISLNLETMNLRTLEQEENIINNVKFKNLKYSNSNNNIKNSCCLII